MTTLGIVRQAAGACLFGMALHAHAASLQISPVILNMNGAERATSMTLRNEGPAPIYGQIRVYAWTQTMTQDVLKETSALVASPPMIQIAPGATQVVRLLQPDPASRPGETSYRLIIDEIAPPDPLGATGVQVRLRYSVPVFVGAAPQTPAQQHLAWSLVSDGPDWALRVDNSGAHRAQLSDVALVVNGQRRSVRDGLLGYVLAGSARQWSLPFQPSMHGSISVKARVNSVPVQVDVQSDAGK
ncbi:fimbrial biogenesis chaperone [Achromobacter insolitus]|uniref:fimbrial biogenesis chaperone n=1 Tax=Achromobacter insolitus TaxID=217204 RepID=UPI0013E300D3|nr:molecular chaperone [Achromobacter insolitus]NGT13204.1 molecular chaperone [Achromobacter insolitus]